MSIRRPTGRDRRGSAGLRYPSISGYYSLGIKIHFDAALGITQTGRGVSQWNDQSGNGNHLVQATDANRPLYVTGDTPSGSPCVHFDAASTQLAKLSGATNASAAAYTLFFVVKRLANSTRAYQHDNGGGTAGITLKSTTGNRQVTCQNSTSLTDGAWSANYEVQCWRIAASGGFGTAVDTNELYINGVLQTAPTGTPNLLQATNVIVMGITGSTGAFKFAEVAEAPGTLLSAYDCIALSKGLMLKHGVT